MCFSGAWLMQILIWAVIAIATYVILIQILLPFVLSKLQASGAVGQGVNVVLAVLRVVFWAIIIIIVIYIVFALLACLWSFAGGSLGSLMPHGR
jgi:hypothetical protein